jgi:hypothetical protein
LLGFLDGGERLALLTFQRSSDGTDRRGRPGAPKSGAATKTATASTSASPTTNTAIDTAVTLALEVLELAREPGASASSELRRSGRAGGVRRPRCARGAGSPLRHAPVSTTANGDSRGY